MIHHKSWNGVRTEKSVHKIAQPFKHFFIFAVAKYLIDSRILTSLGSQQVVIRRIQIVILSFIAQPMKLKAFSVWLALNPRSKQINDNENYFDIPDCIFNL